METDEDFERPMTMETRDIRENVGRKARSGMAVGRSCWNWDTKKPPRQKKNDDSLVNGPSAKIRLGIFCYVLRCMSHFLGKKKADSKRNKNIESIWQENGFSIQILFIFNNGNSEEKNVKTL